MKALDLRELKRLIARGNVYVRNHGGNLEVVDSIELDIERHMMIFGIHDDSKPIDKDKEDK